MAASIEFPALAPIPRRAKADKGAPGRAAPRRVLAPVKVLTYDLAARAVVTETSFAYVRELPEAVAGLPFRHREAALAYAKAIEEVEAGGATDPEARATGKGGGVGGKEGRQFHAIRHVEHLRRIEAAIGASVVVLGCRKGEVAPVYLPARSILRAVALDGLSVSSLIASVRIGRNNRRQSLILAEIIASTGRIADALGLVDPVDLEKKHGGANMA